MFEPFPKLSRFSQGWTVTEKIDGTNASILITDDGDFHTFSRKREIKPGDDNAGFAHWAFGNKEALIEALGPGRHFGEWWGSGIQRNYGLKEKRFSLFNVHRWEGMERFEGLLYAVPVFMLNEYVDKPGEVFVEYMNTLKEGGSLAAPGFMNPEGIVIHHRASGVMFKKTFDYDEAGKWAENQERKTA